MTHDAFLKPLSIKWDRILHSFFKMSLLILSVSTKKTFAAVLVCIGIKLAYSVNLSLSLLAVKLSDKMLFLPIVLLYLIDTTTVDSFSQQMLEIKF